MTPALSPAEPISALLAASPVVPKVPVAQWRKRFDGCRSAREQLEESWALNARLWAMSQAAGPRSTLSLDGSEDLLGRRDRISLGMVHRNCEQTMALLDMPEVSISATLVEFGREIDTSDEAAENLVAAAIGQSLRDSGMLGGMRVADLVKQAALICGHGVTYTHWRQVTREVDLGTLSVFEVSGLTMDGSEDLQPALDDAGNPRVEPLVMTETVREQCQDVFVSPLDFLFDSQAPSIAASGWHAFEQVVRLKDLEADSRFVLPPGCEERLHERENLFDERPGTEEVTTRGVAIVTAYDKATRQLVVFLDESVGARLPDSVVDAEARAGTNLVCILAETFPVDLADPDASPFSAFVPIPLIDFPWGISQIGTIRSVAETAEKLESRQSTQTLSQKRIFVSDANSGVTDEEIRTAMSAPDFAVVQIQNGLMAPLDKLLTELPMPRPTAETYSGIERAKGDMAATSGVSDVPYGGAGTATESENMMQIGGARVTRKRGLFLAFLEQVADLHLAFLAAFAPPAQTLMVPGTFGPEPMRFGREAFSVGRFRLRVAPGGSAAADTPVQQKAKVDFAGMVAPLAGPALKLELLSMMATSLGIHDQARLRRAAVQDLMGAPPALPEAGSSGVDGRIRGETSSPEVMAAGQVMRAGVNRLNES